MAIERPSNSAGLSKASGTGLTGMLAELTPALMEWLSADTYSDGSKRELSTFTIFVEDGLVKMCLNDRDQGRTSWVTADSLEGCLSLMDERLRLGKADWKKSQWAKAKKK